MNIEFFSPVNIEPFESKGSGLINSLSNKVKIHSHRNGFPDLNDVSVVIFGVKEGRKAVDNEDCGKDLSNIREEFYKLFPGKWHIQIADLGDIEQGETIEDTYFAVSDTLEFLLKKNIIPVIIGGGQDLTYAAYRGYDNLEQTVNLVSVDSKFNIGTIQDELDSNSFLSKIIMQEPNNLFNYSNIGYQTYFNTQEEIELLNNLYFETYRLGIVKNIELVEPILRDADIVSVDIGSIRKSDAPGNRNASPNGFFGEEICAVMRYAGISDKVSSLGIYEYNGEVDVDNQTAKLISQMLWYFVEGVNSRAKDYPYVSQETYHKFSVVLEDDDPINFYKSDKSGRWWMEINLISNNKHRRHALIPCAYEDYLMAVEQKIPERWYKAQQKLM